MIPYFEQPCAELGPLRLCAFGVVVAASVLAGLEIGRRRFRRFDLDTSVGERLAWWAIAGGFIGAHLFSVLFYFPRDLVENPVLLFQVWKDISSFGSIIGGALGIWLFFRFRAPAISVAQRWAYVDVAAFAFTVALMVGRIACTLAHDHPGTITRFPLGISLATDRAREYITRVYADAGRIAELPPPDALAQMGFHNLGWYEFAYLAVFVVPVLVLLDRRMRPAPFFLAAFIAMYMPIRFMLDFLRVSDARYLGLTPAQWTALAAIGALPLLVTRVRGRGAISSAPAETRSESRISARMPDGDE